MNEFKTHWLNYQRALARHETNEALAHLDQAINTCEIECHIEHMGKLKGHLLEMQAAENAPKPVPAPRWKFWAQES